MSDTTSHPVPGSDPTTGQDQGERRRRPRGTVPAVVAASLLVLLGGLYVAGYLLAGDRVPRNASVAGVEIGGLERVQAEQVLDEQLAERAQAPLQLDVAEETFELEPTASGLGVDVAGSVREAGAGRSWNPLHIWQVLTGGSEQDPEVVVDEARLSQAVADVAAEVDGEASDAEVTYDGVEVVVSESRPGITVDQEATVTTLAETYRGQVGAEQSSNELTAAAEVVEPGLTTEQAETFASEVAEPAVSDDVTVTVTEVGDLVVTPAAIAAASTIETADNGDSGEAGLRVVYDAEVLLAESQDEVDQLELGGSPRDAYWRLSGGSPELVPARTGRSLTAADLLAAVEPVLAESGEARTAELEPATEAADFTTEDAEAAAVSEVTGEFTTFYPPADYRDVNLGQVAERVDNYWLAPGETFSMNDVVGRRTAANGFAEGFVIQDGVLVEESGGGVSQGATTLFNAAFAAGLEDVEHHPHSLYFDRYPAGREATVYFGTLDLRFRNNTDYGVIIEADRTPAGASGQGSLRIRIWSTPSWDEIRTPEPATSDFTTGERIESDDPDCQYQAPTPGLTASFYRAFINDGQEVDRDSYTWTYDPGDEIVCQ